MRDFSSRTLAAVAALTLAVGALGCDETFTNEGDPPEVVEPDLRVFKGVGVGAECESTADCRDGLKCKSGTCTPSGSKVADDKCLLTAECEAGLHCGWAGFCVTSGDKPIGGECATSADCSTGLYCDIQGVGGHCVSPNGADGDLDAECEGTADCLAGLVCSTNSWTCQPGSILLTPDLFPGVVCPGAAEAEMPFGVRMQLPDEDGDGFYSLPFPNDVHAPDGEVDLSAHPRPGDGIIGIDPLGAVIDAISDEKPKGFSLLPGVFFRFTRPVDPETLRSDGGDATIRFVDLDRDELQPFTFQFKPDRNKYICANHLFVQPELSKPLKANTTYAVFITDGVRAEPPEGEDVSSGDLKPEQLDVMELLLDSVAPGGNKKKKAWVAYSKLRAWLSAHGISSDLVMGAAVFTTADPASIMGDLRAAVHKAAAPSVNGGYTICLSGTTSPCEDPNWADTTLGAAGLPDPRKCPDVPSNDFYEVHTKVRMPVFQDGERPYLDGGGELHVGADGKAAVGSWEDVCVAISIPKNKVQPDDGWPVLVYGHGTGGSMRSGISSLASQLATMDHDNQGGQGAAIIAYDMPMHGTRRNMDVDPGPLFYNYRNPVAARTNYYQGAADVMAFARFAAGFDTSLPVIGPVKLDGARIAYHGHSQGGGQGPLFAPFEPDIPLVVLSGTGGGVVDGFLGKKLPYDSSVGMRIMLHELDITETHPALHVLQYYFDAIDPAIYAPLLDTPPSGQGVHLLQVYGHNDSFTPPKAMRTYAAGANTDLAEPSKIPTWYDSMTDLKVQHISLPAFANRTVNGEDFTRVTIQALNDPDNSYLGTEYDGHFVIYNDETANTQFLLFLRSWLIDGVPVVVDL